MNNTYKYLGFSITLHIIFVCILFLKLPFLNKLSIDQTIAEPIWLESFPTDHKTKDDALPPPDAQPLEPEQPKADDVHDHSDEKEKILSEKIQPKPVIEEPTEEDIRKKVLEKYTEAAKNTSSKPKANINNFQSQASSNGAFISTQELQKIKSSPEFSTYYNEIEEITSNNFIWLRERKNTKTFIGLHIQPETGEIISPEIIKSSGDSLYDQAALRAVKKSSPLPVPPASMQKIFLQEKIVIRF